MKSWNDRLNISGINGIKIAPRAVGDVIESQPTLPTARQDVEMDVRALRTAVAIEHGAEVTCRVTTGYHLCTVAEAAKEDLERGMTLSNVPPFWRVLDAGTPIARKLSFGAEFVAAQRKREGLKP